MFLSGVTPWGHELYWGNNGDLLFRSALVTHALDSSPASGSQGREGKVYSLLYMANCGHYLLPAWTHGLQGWCNALITYNAWCKTTSTLTGTLLSTLLWYLLLATRHFVAGSLVMNLTKSYWKWLLPADTIIEWFLCVQCPAPEWTMSEASFLSPRHWVHANSLPLYKISSWDPSPYLLVIQSVSTAPLFMYMASNVTLLVCEQQFLKYEYLGEDF